MGAIIQHLFTLYWSLRYGLEERRERAARTQLNR
jgi:hypothetical protein